MVKSNQELLVEAHAAAERAAAAAREAVELAERLSNEAKELAQQIAAQENTPKATVSLTSNEGDSKDASDISEDEAKKNKTKGDDSSSDDDSDSADDSEDEKEVKADETKKQVADKDDDSSSSSSGSSSESEDEEEDGKDKTMADTSSKKVEVAKDKDDDDSSSSSSGSSSESEDEEEDKKDVTMAEVKKQDEKADKSDDDSSSSDGSSSESEDEQEDEADKSAGKRKEVATPTFNEERPNKRINSENNSGGDGSTNIYVRGLPWKAGEHDVREFFQQCGEIQSIELPLMDDGRSSGTAIVAFTTSEASAAAIELNGADFNGRWLSIKYSTPRTNYVPHQPSQKEEGCTTVFIGNLSWDIDEDTLRQYFGECGEISQVRFATDRETGDFKGFGHVEFVDTEATDKAVAMAGTQILGRPVRVDYANNRRQSGGFSPGGRGGGRGRGRGGGRGGGGGGGRGRGRGGFGGIDRAKKSGGIAEFSGNKITFD